MSGSALVLDENEWQLMERIARSYLESGNDWAEHDEDDEALEVRSARALCVRILAAGGLG